MMPLYLTAVILCCFALLIAVSLTFTLIMDLKRGDYGSAVSSAMIAMAFYVAIAFCCWALLL